MKYLKLRIAFSATCLIACVLLVVLWVRSYKYADIAHHAPMRYEAISVRGRLKLSRLAVYLPVAQPVLSYPVGERLTDVIETHVIVLANPAGFGVVDHRSILLPHWFMVTVSAILAGLPWVRRFTVRTLLIATTLVAVVLGAVVYATR